MDLIFSLKLIWIPLAFSIIGTLVGFSLDAKKRACNMRLQDDIYSSIGMLFGYIIGIIIVVCTK